MLETASNVAGDGLNSSITGSSVTRAGGGGGFKPIYTFRQVLEEEVVQESPKSIANGATANTGGGGGGGASSVPDGGDGGSGVVILRMPTADYSGTTTGSPTVSTDGTDTILTFNSSGSYTA
jgi:hypothetical protein